MVQELQPKSRTSVTSAVAFAVAAVAAVFVLWSAVVLPLVAPIWTLPGAIGSYIMARKSRAQLYWVLFTVFVLALLVSVAIDTTLLTARTDITVTTTPVPVPVPSFSAG